MTLSGTSGIYYIRVETNEGSAVIKVVKL
ncbi:MAG: T9SS type A sorting domain-containing protein [Bacteroidetes bacterium]|nr:T9SS type A sorting domain-containing protein [Bacteroidota bacterium]